MRSAPLFELADCRRTSTVAEYQDRFQALLARAGPLAESQKVQLFTGGLLPPLSIDVGLQNPQSLAAAMSIARQLELREQIVASLAKTAPRGTVMATTPRPAILGSGANKAPTPTITVEGRPVKRLTQAEQEEIRRLGLCYNCDEKYGRGHNRVCKKLFLLDCIVEDDDVEAAGEETAETETPLFSLHAVTEVATAETMQIRVSLGTATFLALLDTGSTHNFIAEAAARSTGLTVQPRPRLTATVANGEKVPCPGVIRQA